MKLTIKLPILFLAFLTGFLIQATTTFAHFGSKGPYGGSVSCGIVNDTIVYLGTTNGGVFFSSKQSLTGWTCKPVGLKSGKITALAHTGMGAPTDYNAGVTIFAGTADSGVFRFTGLVGSSDRYWEKVNTGLTNLKIKSLLALGTNTLIAGTDGGGVFKTTDNGASWASSNTGLSGTAIITGIVKAGTRIIAASQAGGLFKSDDNGATWSGFNDINTSNIAGTNALSYNAVTDELLVLNNNGLFSLASASTISSASYITSQANLPAGTTVRSISNNGSDWYLATNNGVYTSATSSINWVTVNTGLTTAALDVNTVVPVAFSSSRLVLGTNSEGVYKSPAGTVSWTVNNITFNNIATYSMAASGDLLLVAATENGVFISKDLGASYSITNTGLTDSLNVTDIIYANGYIIAATKNAGVFFTSDTAKTAWITAGVGLTSLNVKKLFYSNMVKYALGSDGNVYRSPLSSTTWTLIQTGLPTGVVPTGMAFYRDKMILSTNGHGVYIKILTGTTWASANAGLSNLNVTSVVINVKNIFIGTDGSGVFISDTAAIAWSATSATSIAHTTMINLDGTKIQAMASLGSFVFASYKGGLLATSDNGATWIAGGNQFNLPSYTNVNTIAFVSSYVLVTTDNNSIYGNKLSELPLAAKIEELQTTSSSNTCDASATAVVGGGTVPYTYQWSNGETTQTAVGLCAGTYTLIVTDFAGKKDTVTTNNVLTSIKSNENVLSNFVIYPNPNDGKFTLSFTTTQLRTIELYNTIGVLVQRFSENESSYIPINVDSTSGIYFVRVISKDGISTKKMIIE